MAGWPIVINGNTYQESDFEPWNYPVNFPRIFNDLLAVSGAFAATIPYVFDSSTTDSDPGSGKLRMNHATPSSATALYLDNASATGVTVSDLIDTFDDYGTSTNRGYLRIQDASTLGTVYFYAVSGSVVDGTGYRKLTIAYISGTGTLTAGGSLAISFVGRGDTGSATSSADVAWTGDISPSQITADQDDYNPSSLSTAAVIRHDIDAEREIRGLAGGSDGRLMAHLNVSTAALKKRAQRASSTAANRFSGRDLELDPGMAGLDIYDSTSSRWRPVGYRMRPRHIECVPDPFPAVPCKPLFYADWASMPWLDRYLALTRGSEAMYRDSKGKWYVVGSGVPRFHSLTNGYSGLLIEGARTNYVRNNTLVGAVAGSSGTMPTNWSITTPTGLTRTLSLETVDGVPCLRVKLEGTASSTARIDISVESGVGQIAAVQNELFVHSAFIQFLSVTGLSGAGNMRLELWEFNASNSFLTGSGEATEWAPSVEARLTRRSYTRTITNAAAAWIRPMFRTSTTIASGTSCNIEFLIGLPQVEKGGMASTPIRTSGASATRSAESLALSNNGDIINTYEMTMFVEVLLQEDDAAASSTRQFMNAHNGTTSERVSLHVTTGDNTSSTIMAGGVAAASLVVAGFTYGSLTRAAVSAIKDNFNLSKSGTGGTPDTSGNMPAVTQFEFGAAYSGSQAFGIIRRAAVFPVALSLSDMNAMTS